MGTGSLMGTRSLMGLRESDGDWESDGVEGGAAGVMGGMCCYGVWGRVLDGVQAAVGAGSGDLAIILGRIT